MCIPFSINIISGIDSAGGQSGYVYVIFVVFCYVVKFSSASLYVWGLWSHVCKGLGLYWPVHMCSRLSAVVWKACRPCINSCLYRLRDYAAFVTTAGMIFGAQWPVQRFTKGTAMLSPLQLHFLILGQSEIWIQEAFKDTALRGWGLHCGWSKFETMEKGFTWSYILTGFLSV